MGVGGGDMHSAFARHAEESSRPAFESIESIVSAVNSVGMMLDSTFGAVYNSFRAVIGVADNFSRLKTQLVQVFSALAFIRTLRYLFRRLLELLRLRPQGEADRRWMEAFREAAQSAPGGPDGPGGPKKSSWPILMFFGIIMGGPYLIWRLISAFNSSPAGDGESWASGDEDHFVARASYNFQGQGGEELSFKAGQNIVVAPKERQPQVKGWLLASVDGKATGLIPANYVKILGKRRGKKNSASGDAPPSQPQALTQTEMSQQQMSQAFQSATPTPQPFAATATATSSIPEQEFDSMFSGVSSSFPSSTTNANDLNVIQNNPADTSNQEASDILSSVDTVR